MEKGLMAQLMKGVPVPADALQTPTIIGCMNHIFVNSACSHEQPPSTGADWRSNQREREMAVAQFGANAASIEEIITDATVVALNAALAEHGVSPDRVVAIHYLEGVYVANGPSPRFRVLYRV